jgi:hypothetical protein
VKLRALYLLLCIAGIVLPYSQFVPWVMEHGVDLPSFFAALFANRIGAFFGLDVIVSALVLFVFVLGEGRREKVPMPWLPIVGTLAVGVSFGLPLFLYLRASARSSSP